MVNVSVRDIGLKSKLVFERIKLIGTVLEIKQQLVFTSGTTPRINIDIK